MVDREGSEDFAQELFDGDGVHEMNGASLSEYLLHVVDKQNCDNPERQCEFMQLINNLSNEAKQVIRIVLDTPFELWAFLAHSDSLSKTVCVASLREYLRFHGWRYAAINKAFEQISFIFKN